MQYCELARTYLLLENTTKRLEKTRILSDFIAKVPDAELSHIMLLLQGRIFPLWDSREAGMSTQLLLAAIAVATGTDQEKAKQHWAQSGDMGKTAEALVARKKQKTFFAQQLTTSKVFDNLHKIATQEGQGTVDKKIALFAELLTNAKPEEAKYLARTLLGELRVGLGEGTIRDAIVWAAFGKELGLAYDAGKNEIVLPENNRQPYEQKLEAVQKAIDIANDFGTVSLALREKGIAGLDAISIQPGRPVKVMMYQKAQEIPDAFETVGTPAAAEYKYDGFLLQIHKCSGNISLFTRRLENVTAQFPDVAERIAKYVSGDNFIIEAEAAGIDRKTGKYLAFQNISQRIKRKYGIHGLANQYPIEVNVFDILCRNGKSQLNTPFAERRKIVEEMVRPMPGEIMPATQAIVSTAAEAEEFYKKSLAAGNEGIMMKNLSGIYKPGLRVGHGMKIKPVMEPLDVVIVSAEKGEGKRSMWFASFTMAVKNTETGQFEEIGKVGTGFKEKEEEGTTFGKLTELLLPLITKDLGKEVTIKPFMVIEVNYEEIQASPSYSSGFALRFPRFIRLREDRNPDDISTTEDIKRLYGEQRGRNA